MRTRSEKAGPQPDVPVEGIVLVDFEFRFIAGDHDGSAILREMGETDGTECPPAFPSQLEKAVRAVPRDALEATTLRISAGDHSYYTCEVFVMQPQKATVFEPLLAIYVKKERSLREAVRRAGSQYRLTEREEETLLGIASGLTSRQIAENMNISPNTVNAFLRLIMVKMGVTTRAGVVGKLMNGNGETTGPAASRSGAQGW